MTDNATLVEICSTPKRWHERIFEEILKPLIFQNAKRRYHGLCPDEWYWADLLATKWGHYAEFDTRDFGRVSPERAREVLDGMGSRWTDGLPKRRQSDK